MLHPPGTDCSPIPRASNPRELPSTFVSWILATVPPREPPPSSVLRATSSDGIFFGDRIHDEPDPVRPDEDFLLVRTQRIEARRRHD